jgi:hypothetical protein
MIYDYQIDGVPLRTGDLICTTDGGSVPVGGEIWRLIGQLIPGEVDHVVVYVGPDGLCVEAGAKLCVTQFTIPGDTWDSQKMFAQRGPLIDEFYGVAYPLAGKGIADAEQVRIRESVARYCLKQARERKPYNVNFANSGTETAFYCSQLAYKAYLRKGIDLNTGRGVPQLPGTESIIFPQEIWSGCKHKRP